ncbi:MAG: protein kinase domain-containing protein [Nitrososphaeraceae archaeon]
MDEKFSSNSQYYFDVRWTLNRIILHACNALAQARSSNIYHRDLKPSNIMFTDSSRSSIKITDWGLVKITDPTRSREESGDNVSSSSAAAVDVDRKSLELTAVVGEGSIGGTPDYCSPEQWFASAQKTSETVDGRTDIFSLGIIRVFKFGDFLFTLNLISLHTSHLLSTSRSIISYRLPFIHFSIFTISLFLTLILLLHLCYYSSNT